MTQTTHLIEYDGLHVFNDLRVYVNATYPDMELTRSWNIHPCADGGVLVSGCCYEWRIGEIGGDAMKQWLRLWRIDAGGNLRFAHKLPVLDLLRVDAFALDNLSVVFVDENTLLLAVGTERGAVVVPAYFDAADVQVDWGAGALVANGVAAALPAGFRLVGLALPWTNVSLSPGENANWRLDHGRWSAQVGLDGGRVWARYASGKQGEWQGALGWNFAGRRYSGSLGTSGTLGKLALTGDVRYAVKVLKDGPMPSGGGASQRGNSTGRGEGRDGGGGSEPAQYEDLEYQPVPFTCAWQGVTGDMRPAAPDHGLYHDMRHFTPLAWLEVRCPWEGENYDRNRLAVACSSANIYRYSQPFINYGGNLCVVDGGNLRLLLENKGDWWEGKTLNAYERATFPREVSSEGEGSGSRRPGWPGLEEERVVCPSRVVFSGGETLGQTGWLTGVCNEHGPWLLLRPDTLHNYATGRSYVAPVCRQEGEVLEWSKAAYKWAAFMQRVVERHRRFGGVEILRFRTAANRLWLLHKTVCFDPCGNSDDTLEKGSSLHLTAIDL